MKETMVWVFKGAFLAMSRQTAIMLPFPYFFDRDIYGAWILPQLYFIPIMAVIGLDHRFGVFIYFHFFLISSESECQYLVTVSGAALF